MMFMKCNYINFFLPKNYMQATCREQDMNQLDNECNIKNMYFVVICALDTSCIFFVDAYSL